MHKRYDPYFGDSPFYSSLMRIFEIEHMVNASEDSNEVCLVFIKGDYTSSRTWSVTMLDFLDDDVLEYAIKTEIISMLTEICEIILNETKL